MRLRSIRQAGSEMRAQICQVLSNRRRGAIKNGSVVSVVEREPMVVVGPTTRGHAQRWAGNLLKAARARTGLTQRDVAAAAGVPRATIAQIESGRRQPSFPLLYRILVEGTGLEPRTRLEPFDEHDTVLDAIAITDPEHTVTSRHHRDQVLAAATPVRDATNALPQDTPDSIRTRATANPRHEG